MNKQTWTELGGEQTVGLEQPPGLQNQKTPFWYKCWPKFGYLSAPVMTIMHQKDNHASRAQETDPKWRFTFKYVSKRHQYFLLMRRLCGGASDQRIVSPPPIILPKMGKKHCWTLEQHSNKTQHQWTKNNVQTCYEHSFNVQPRNERSDTLMAMYADIRQLNAETGWWCRLLEYGQSMGD